MFSAKDILKNFLEPLQNEDASKVIMLADKEATLSFRKAMRSCRQGDSCPDDWCDYSAMLKDVIACLRYDAAPRRLDPKTHQMVRSIKSRSRAKTALRELNAVARQAPLHGAPERI